MGAPDDPAALEEAAWAAFVAALGDHLAAQWPEMHERLGERYPAFIDLALQQAAQRGLCGVGTIARYVNLWFVWGPAYHDKPGFEWAQQILALHADREWLALHQLVRRSAMELQRIQGARIEPQALEASDARLIDRFGGLGLKGAMHRPEPPPLPRAACDLEALELRLAEDASRQEYELGANGDWQRVPAPVPPPLRVLAGQPMPARIAVLSHRLGEGRQAQLQLRSRMHARCDVDVHPALGFLGPHGHWRWRGHEVQATRWSVATREQPDPPLGPGTLVADETSPELHQLSVETCGLRDDGDAIGPLKALVAAWPATQWWMEVQRAQPQPQALLPGPRAWVRGVTRTRVERDGDLLDAAPLRAAFETGLDAAVAEALQKLAAAWEHLPSLEKPTLDANLGVLSGRAAFTWGWRLPPEGLAGKALMRVVADIDLRACECELELVGELLLAGARTRLTLRCAGRAPWRATLRHDSALPTAATLLDGARLAWRFPFTLTVEPLATDGAALVQATGPVSGALVGEAGLRPNVHGGSGWEWFATMKLEAAAVPLACVDPLLGARAWLQPLLPALDLLDWSLG